jgi:hypothetical protein
LGEILWHASQVEHGKATAVRRRDGPGEDGEIFFPKYLSELSGWIEKIRKLEEVFYP